MPGSWRSGLRVEVQAAHPDQHRHLYAHAGRILALQEVNLPFELTPELDTVGPYDFGGALKTVMTAHPKIDRVTGEMLFISNSPAPPHLTYHVVANDGRLVHSEVIEGPGASVIHDFAITDKHVVFFDPSVTLDLKSGLAFPYTWNEGYRARIGVLPRDRTRGAVQWIDVPAYYYFHLANGYEDAAGRIIVEGTYYDRAAWEYAAKWINSLADHGPWLVNGSRWARWTIDPRSGTAKVEMRDDLSVEFPTVDFGKLGRPARYSYAVAFPAGGLKHTAIAKYDGQTGRRELLELEPGQMPGEPFFVADPRASSEDGGWLFTYVNDLRTHRSELWLIDASAMRSPPVAAIEIPGWVPAGVHGSWIADTELERRS